MRRTSAPVIGLARALAACRRGARRRRRQSGIAGTLRQSRPSGMELHPHASSTELVPICCDVAGSDAGSGWCGPLDNLQLGCHEGCCRRISGSLAFPRWERCYRGVDVGSKDGRQGGTGPAKPLVDPPMTHNG